MLNDNLLNPTGRAERVPPQRDLRSLAAFPVPDRDWPDGSFPAWSQRSLPWLIACALLAAGCGGTPAPCATPLPDLDRHRAEAENLRDEVDRAADALDRAEDAREAAATRVEAARASLDSIPPVGKEP